MIVSILAFVSNKFSLSTNFSCFFWGLFCVVVEAATGSSTEASQNPILEPKAPISTQTVTHSIESRLSYTEHPQYKKLKALEAHYLKNNKKSVPRVPIFSLQEGSPHLKILLQALILHRCVPESSSASITQVRNGIKTFQQSRGLVPSGELNKKTLALLYGSIDPILKKIQNTLKEWEEMENFTTEHLIVNIPSFTLVAFRSSSEDATAPCYAHFSTPVVVGKLENPTPTFNGKITDVVIHPTWYIPPNHVNRLKGNVGSRGYVWENGRLVQRPGPNNPLGPIKFLTRGHGDIIFHGTNKPEIFKKKIRAESLGCIRVKDPLSLSYVLLEDHPEKKNVPYYLHKKRTRYLSLSKPFAVHVLYLTIWINNQDVPLFFPDVYGYEDIEPTEKVCYNFCTPKSFFKKSSKKPSI